MKQCGAAVNALNQFLFPPIEMEGLSRWTLDPRFHAYSQDSNSCQPSIAEYLLVIGVHLTALTSIDPLYSGPCVSNSYNSLTDKIFIDKSISLS